MGILNDIADIYVDAYVNMENLHERLDVDKDTSKYCIKNVMKYKLNKELNLNLQDDTKYFVIDKEVYYEAVKFAQEEITKLGKHGDEYMVRLLIKSTVHSRLPERILYNSKDDKNPEKDIQMPAIQIGKDTREIVSAKLKLDVFAKIANKRMAYVMLFVQGVPIIEDDAEITVPNIPNGKSIEYLTDIVGIAAGKADKTASYIDSKLLSDGRWAEFNYDSDKKKYESMQKYFESQIDEPLNKTIGNLFSKKDINEIKESAKEYLPYKYWRDFGLDINEIPEERIKEADEKTKIDFAKSKGTYKYEAAEQNKVKATSKINNEELKKMYDEYIAKGYNTNIIVYQNIIEKRLISNDIQLKIGFEIKDLDFDDLQVPNKKTLGIEGKKLRIVFNFFNIDMNKLIENIDMDNVDLIMLNSCEITNGHIPAELSHKIKQFH